MQKDHPQGPEEEADHLLSLLKKGDKSGLEQLFRMFYKPLVIYAHRLLGNQADAEDAVQEIFIKFWQRDQFADIRSYLRSYLYNSVRNHCVNILESRKGKTSVPLESIPDIPDESTIAEKARTGETPGRNPSGNRKNCPPAPATSCKPFSWNIKSTKKSLKQNISPSIR